MCVSFFYTKTQEPYEFLLLNREWKSKRERIFIRDGHCCQKCGAKGGDGIFLHVHHKHYIFGLDPWEYKDSELITLCEECHSHIHANGEVPVYRLNDGNLQEVILTPCSRCGGAGYLPQYKHVQNGICFRCHGSRYDEFIVSSENYALEHDIDLRDFEDGFRDIIADTAKRISHVDVIQSQFDKNKMYLKIHLDGCTYINALLDFSVNAKPGDKLDVKTLKVKEGYKLGSNKPYYIIKGKVLRALA